MLINFFNHALNVGSDGNCNLVIHNDRVLRLEVDRVTTMRGLDMNGNDQ